MTNGIVNLTFDFDALSFWVYSGQTSPAPLSRGEFGAHAIERLLHLFASRNIKITFFIPGHTIDTYPDQCKAIVSAGHEVGLHGYLHEPVSALSPEEERDVFRHAYDIVGNLTGTAPRGSRTPGWDYTPHTIDIMLELGLLYDSSLMSTDYTPFYTRQGDVVHPDGRVEWGEESALVQLPVSWSLDDFPHFEFMSMPGGNFVQGLKTARDVYKNFLDDVVYMERDFTEGVMNLTCHPFVSGRGHRFLALERFIDEVQGMGVRFERCDTVAQQFKEGHTFGVYNPQGSAAEALEADMEA
jgi:peptidoglycan/xylan/chitin deacetylase (PgdA/CDA1 family)